MKKYLITVLGWLALAFSTHGLAADATPAQQKAEIRKSHDEILQRLYKVNPSAKAAINAAAGYAVFSNFGMKIFVAGGGAGKGVAVDNRTRQETFMKMVEVQAGLGIGIKKFQLVFIFEQPEALKNFIESGWEAGAQASAAATDGKSGGAYQGAISVSPGVWLYQLTSKGLALEATIKGTKYYRDDTLNK
jgi:lipid-binding SYLF domain-containing protein